MKLLPPPSGDFFFVTTAYSLADLWEDLFFTHLRYHLPCNPFKLNGQWTAALVPTDRIYGDQR